MLQEQRKQLILQYVAEHSFGDVDALVDVLKVSPATVRRDLNDLAERGQIIRTRGGASLPTHGVGHEIAYHARARENVKAKQVIAQAAKALIQEGEVIGIDVGSTTVELAKVMRDLRNITVFTASMLVAELLAKSEINVVLVGGTLRKREMSVAGPIAAQVINQFYYDKFFLGTAGITIEDGFTDFSIDDVEVKKAFLGHAKQIIALADSSKLGKVSFAKICPANCVDRLVTDSQADRDDLERLGQTGPEITIVEL
jgi:DeoR family transcriptional regulator, fructose operon transcriptional repressor